MPAYRIASPCPASWDSMPGDDRVRHCTQCDLDVYNFSGMTEVEIAQLVKGRTGRLCARFYQRADGTMLTRNCSPTVPTVSFRTSLPAIALSALVSIAPATTLARQPSFYEFPSQSKSPNEALLIQVQDISGAAVSGAAIALVNATTGERVTAQTGTIGEFSAAKLPAGEYDLTITHPGFASYMLKGLTVPTRVPAVVATLQIAVMGEVVVIGPEPLGAAEPSSTLSSVSLSEPTTTGTPLKPANHPNALQRLFSRLHRVFQ